MLGFPGGSVAKEISLQCRRPRFSPWVQKVPWREGMATYSSVLAWSIPWAEEPGGLQSMSSQENQAQLSSDRTTALSVLLTVRNQPPALPEARGARPFGFQSSLTARFTVQRWRARKAHPRPCPSLPPETPCPKPAGGLGMGQPLFSQWVPSGPLTGVCDKHLPLP